MCRNLANFESATTPQEEVEQDFSQIPKTFWCKHWFKPNTKEIIADGESCCFNHFIGLPARAGKTQIQRHPLYNYQEEILDCIDKDEQRLYWILKSPKLGITELWIRFMLHKCLTDPLWENCQCILTIGTKMSEAQRLITRCKNILHNKFNKIDYSVDEYNTKDTFTLNKSEIIVVSANNAGAIRSKENAKFIMVDEGAYVNNYTNNDVRGAAEHYMSSTYPYIVFISTAGMSASGFMYEIGETLDSGYNKFEFLNPEKYGSVPHIESGTSIYDPEYLEFQKKSPLYEKDFLGRWGYGTGTIFDSDLLQEITTNYKIKSPATNYSVLAVDPAYGAATSKSGARFGMLGMYIQDGICYVSDEWEFKHISELDAQKKIHTAMKRGYNALCIDVAVSGLIQDMENAGYYVIPMHFNPVKTNNIMEQVTGGEEPKYDQAMRNCRCSITCYF